MITARHLVIALFLTMAAAGLVHAQDTHSLRPGFYEAEDIDWSRTGEWTRKTEDGQTWLSSGSSGSSLSVTVKGLYVLIYRVPEYGGGEMWVQMNQCVELFKSLSAHDIRTASLIDIEGETDLTLQLGAGRLGIDAIEILNDEVKALRLQKEFSDGVSVLNWPTSDVKARECVKRPPEPTATPTPQQPWTYESAREKPVHPVEAMIGTLIPFVVIPAGLGAFIGSIGLLLVLITGIEKTKRG